MKNMLKICSKILIISLLIGATFTLTTCSDSEQKTEKAELSFKNDVFYFNRCDKYKDVDGLKVMNNSRYESGSIEIHGNAIVINVTEGKKNFFIEEEEYDEDMQTYTFTCKDAVISFDVSMRTFGVHYNCCGIGEVFYINSSINSNW